MTEPFHDRDGEFDIDAIEVSNAGGIMWRTHEPLAPPEATLMVYQFTVGTTIIGSTSADAPGEPHATPVLMMQVLGVCGSQHDHSDRWYFEIGAARDLLMLCQRALDAYDANPMPTTT